MLSKPGLTKTQRYQHSFEFKKISGLTLQRLIFCPCLLTGSAARRGPRPRLRDTCCHGPEGLCPETSCVTTEYILLAKACHVAKAGQSSPTQQSPSFQSPQTWCHSPARQKEDIWERSSGILVYLPSPHPVPRVGKTREQTLG